MAGKESTSADGTTQVHSSLVSLTETDDVGEPQVSTAEGSNSAQAELEELRAQNKRYKEQMAGWQSQSQANKQERDALADRLARLEGHVAAVSTPKTQETKTESGLPKGKLGNALKKWLDNDDTEINEIEEYLSNVRSNAQKPENIEEVVTRTLQKFGAKSTLTTKIAEAHPEMADQQSELYGAIFEHYDNYASDPGNRMFFPKDDQFELPVPAPDGSGSKLMDARIVRQLAAELKARGMVTENTRQTRETRSASFGTALTGNGRTTASPRNRHVEAIELLTEGERAEMQNLRMMRAWPKEWPKDDKAAAKMIYDALPATEKAKRTAEYRRQQGR
jgi:hypothetical protein